MGGELGATYRLRGRRPSVVPNGVDTAYFDFVPPEERPGGVLYVGFAPACPQANPSAFAPCIVSQTGDGNGGNITTGWLPGGDPPRRT